MKRRVVVWLLGGLGIGALAVLAFREVRRYQGRMASPGILPTPFPTREATAIADTFDYPLDPTHFGACIPHQSSPPPIDTRFGAQNPALENTGKCFIDTRGTNIPFSQLYHAGEDWLALNKRGRIIPGKAAGQPVHAVANGIVESITLMGFDGYVVIVGHTLPDFKAVWSVYWHVANVQVAVGEAMSQHQTLAFIHDRGLNSHLHWEIRTFADGSSLFPPDSAGGRGSCNGHVTAVGYTWDDDPTTTFPEAYGYLDPVAFIESRKK